ncbi:hypothetical protein GCM10009605_18650 [Nocardiopsis composta]
MGPPRLTGITNTYAKVGTGSWAVNALPSFHPLRPLWREAEKSGNGGKRGDRRHEESSIAYK